MTVIARHALQLDCDSVYWELWRINGAGGAFYRNLMAEEITNLAITRLGKVRLVALVSELDAVGFGVVSNAALAGGGAGFCERIQEDRTSCLHMGCVYLYFLSSGNIRPPSPCPSVVTRAKPTGFAQSVRSAASPSRQRPR